METLKNFKQKIIKLDEEQRRLWSKMWLFKVEKARKLYKNFDKVIRSNKRRLNANLIWALTYLDNGAHIAYYLGSHPEDLKRIDSYVSREKIFFALGKFIAKHKIKRTV